MKTPLSQKIPAFAAQLALKDDRVLDRLVHNYDVESGNALDSLPVPKPRFVAVFVNGAHVVRDNRYLYHCAGPFLSRKAAVARADMMEAK